MATTSKKSNAVVHGLALIEPVAAEFLILGSIPSVKSIQSQQYYGNPQNAFWWIMANIYDFDLAQLSYEQKIENLKIKHIAIWDVLQQCKRPGSLDSAIDKDSEVGNDIVALLSRHKSLKTIIFNGQKSAQLFKKHQYNAVLKKLSDKHHHVVLPSTSPAHASVSKVQKLQQWREVLLKVN